MLNHTPYSTEPARQDGLLIVNADDFGFDARTNLATLKSFQNQWCSSATLMANMPGFDEACDMIHQYGLNGHVGVHLNLSEGEPLTLPIRRQKRLCDQHGRFRLPRSERVICLTFMECHAVATELRAQIALARSRRISITHLDSHKHLHEELGLLRVVIPLARESRIRYVRRLRNIGPSTSAVKSAYRTALNAWLVRERLLLTRYYGSLADFRHEMAHGSADEVRRSCEIMIHPTLDDDGSVIDLMTREPLEIIRSPLGTPLRIVSYAGKAYDESAANRRGAGGAKKALIAGPASLAGARP